MYPEKNVTLFYCPQMAELARTIAEDPRKIARGTISLKAIQWKSFRDGFPNLFIPDVQLLRGQDVAFLACFDSPGVIFEQWALMRALIRYGIRSLTIILPYFPTGTMDRVNEEGEVATAASLAHLLSALPPTKMGQLPGLVIFDIHTLHEQFYFEDTVMPILASGIPLLKQQLWELQKTEQVSVAFPDEGAQKRFKNLLKDFPQIVCQKVRNGDTRNVTIKEGDALGKHVVMVDDLVMTGGTLLECSYALRHAGASKISAYATHGVFPESTWKLFLGAGFERFWITDSCPLTAKAVQGQGPFQILSLVSLITEHILKS